MPDKIISSNSLKASAPWGHSGAQTFRIQYGRDKESLVSDSEVQEAGEELSHWCSLFRIWSLYPFHFSRYVNYCQSLKAVMKNNGGPPNIILVEIYLVGSSKLWRHFCWAIYYPDCVRYGPAPEFFSNVDEPWVIDILNAPSGLHGVMTWSSIT